MKQERVSYTLRKKKRGVTSHLSRGRRELRHLLRERRSRGPDLLDPAVEPPAELGDLRRQQHARLHPGDVHLPRHLVDDALDRRALSAAERELHIP